MKNDNTYTLIFNPKSMTWCIYRNSTNKLIMQSTDYKQMKIKYDKLNEDNEKNIQMHIEVLNKCDNRGRKSRIYKLYHYGEYVDTGTRKELMNKYIDLKSDVFYRYYKKNKYNVEIVEE